MKYIDTLKRFDLRLTSSYYMNNVEIDTIDKHKGCLSLVLSGKNLNENYLNSGKNKNLNFTIKSSFHDENNYGT